MFKFQERKNVQKEIYIEVIRIVAIILVIFNHTDGYFLYYSNTDSMLTWLFSFIGSVLCRMNVPLFVMITGALILGKEESLRDLYQKRVRRIVLVLLLFTFFYYMLDIFRNSQKNFSLKDFIEGLLSGSIQGSFWYLFLYLGILLVLPLLRKMAVSCENRELRYFLLLQIVTVTGVGVFSCLTGMEVNSSIYLMNIYVYYLFAGYYLGKRIDMDRIPEWWVKGSVVMNLFCLLGTYLMARVDYARRGIYDQEILSLFTPILTLGIFFDIRWICCKHNISGKLRNVIYEAGSCVFGIFLVEHLSRIQLLPVYLYLSERTYGILACSFYVLISLGLSWFYTELLKRIPLIKRLL